MTVKDRIETSLRKPAIYRLPAQQSTNVVQLAEAPGASQDKGVVPWLEPTDHPNPKGRRD
jgi:hypothetical protein